jgi:type IV secretion system protein VirB10
MSETPASPVAQSVSPVAVARRRLTRLQQAGIVALGVGGLIVVFMLTSGPSTTRKVNADDQQQITASGGEDFRPPPVQPPAPPKVQPAAAAMPMPAPATASGWVANSSKDPMQAARESDVVGWSGGTTSSVRTAAPRDPGAPDGKSDDSTPLGQKLRATAMEGSKAAVLPHPDFAITMGTPIPCLPDSPMNSEMPGIVSCHIPIDVRGTTGRVVLLDRGTKLVGQIQGGLMQGQDRLFVNWVRAETPNPNHVIITLNSPGADVIGEPGLDGDIDTHFWKRFGGAIMLSFIDTAFQAAVLAASQHNSQFQFNQFQSNGQDAATVALQNSINIPPTLHRDQALPIVVFTARDLDFSDVYRLRYAGGQ